MPTCVPSHTQQMYVQCFYNLLHNYFTLFKYLSPMQLSQSYFFSIDQTQAASFEIICRAYLGENVIGGAVHIIRKHQHNGKAQWVLKGNSLTPFYITELPNTYTYRAYVTKVGRVQEPFASHISCMTAFHRRGQLH